MESLLRFIGKTKVGLNRGVHRCVGAIANARPLPHRLFGFPNMARAL
jgi:hypothetical protein